MEGPRVIAVLEWSPGASVGLQFGTLCVQLVQPEPGLQACQSLGLLQWVDYFRLDWLQRLLYLHDSPSVGVQVVSVTHVSTLPIGLQSSHL